MDSILELADDKAERLESELNASKHQLSRVQQQMQQMIHFLVPRPLRSPSTDTHQAVKIHTLTKSCLVLIKLSPTTRFADFAACSQQLDHRLQHLVPEFHGFRYQLKPGCVCVVFGLEPTASNPMVQAAKFALSLKRQFQAASGVGIHVAVHCGTVHACALNTSFPRTLFSGDVIEQAMKLCGETPVNEVWISREVKEQLQELAGEKFLFKPLGNNKGKVSAAIYFYCTMQHITDYTDVIAMLYLLQ